MDRKRTLQVLAAIGGGFVTVALLFAALLLARSSRLFGSGTVYSPYGWMIPLSAGLVILGVAWALSSHPRHTAGRMPGMYSVPCTACGKSVMGEWRLCPYCGSLLTPAPADPARSKSGLTEQL